MMHEDKQAVTFIAEAPTDFRSFRVAARSTGLESVQNDDAGKPIVIIKCGPAKQTVLKSIPVTSHSSRLRLRWTSILRSETFLLRKDDQTSGENMWNDLCFIVLVDLQFAHSSAATRLKKVDQRSLNGHPEKLTKVRQQAARYVSIGWMTNIFPPVIRRSILRSTIMSRHLPKSFHNTVRSKRF